MMVGFRSNHIYSHLVFLNPIIKIVKKFSDDRGRSPILKQTIKIFVFLCFVVVYLFIYFLIAAQIYNSHYI